MCINCKFVTKKNYVKMKYSCDSGILNDSKGVYIKKCEEML